MVATVRVAILIAGSCALMAGCGSHHTLDDSPSAGSDGDTGRAGAGRAAGGSAAPAAAGAGQGAAERTPGARAIAMLVPVGPIPADSVDHVQGKATFTAVLSGVDMQLMARGCRGLKPFLVVIMQGGDCGAETLAGPVWDAPRGEGIAGYTCTGAASGVGRSLHSRPYDAPKPWSIGGPPESDLVGHTLVVLDSETHEPAACGSIVRDADVTYVPAPPPGEGPPLVIQAQLAGLCVSTTFAPDNTRECPVPAELTRCASEHCNLGTCIETCADFTACLEQRADPCEEVFECPSSDACTQCQGEVSACTFGACIEELACAPPATPDGPCAQLTACCAMQGEMAMSCLELVKLIERVSGDVSCNGVMHDWDTVAHLPVPCMFQ